MSCRNASNPEPITIRLRIKRGTVTKVTVTKVIQKLSRWGIERPVRENS